jgi:hypothetical protein
MRGIKKKKKKKNNKQTTTIPHADPVAEREGERWKPSQHPVIQEKELQFPPPISSSSSFEVMLYSFSHL